MKSSTARFTAAVGFTVAAAGAAHAAEPANNAHVSGVLVGTYQAAGESQVDGRDVNNEGNAQLYLLGDLAMGPGTWYLELRAGTTPPDQGVTSFYGEVNDAVGETLNANGHGRVAATQLFYQLPVASGDLSVGLLDPSGILDANDIADNEYTQFMGTSFVNDPTVEYPAFALGANYGGKLTHGLGYQLFVSSTGGLEDAEDPTYNNVVDVGEHGKGVFSAGELLWQAGGMSGDVGVWFSSGDHAALEDASDDGRDNYGVYLSGGGQVGPGRWVAWAGLANDRVSAAANFLGAAYSQTVGRSTLGLGLARIGVSDHQPEPADSIVQAEAYWRIRLAGRAYVTPDLQYIDNSGFNPDRDGVVVGTLRVGLEF